MKDFISNLFFQAHRWQPRGRLLKLQEKQFSGKQAKMQWWYYDFFSEEGLIGVFAFIPYKWWPDSSDSETGDSYLMLSLKKPDDSVEQYHKTVDSKHFESTPEGLRLGDRLALDYQVDNGKSLHKLSFDLGGIKGNLEIDSTTDPFSAIPLGALAAVERKLAYGSKWSRSSFRYVSQIPRGRIEGRLSTGNENIDVSGFAYHEQGWFDNDPHLLNKGWYWYHFLHPQCNIFGLPEGYIYVQLNEQTLLGGMCPFAEKYRMETRKYDNSVSSKILTGGRISLEAKGIEIDIYLDSTTHQDLIEFNSIESGQLWNTSVVKSECSISLDDQTHEFSGNAMVETCWLQK